MHRFGAPVAKVAVYVLAVAFWVIAMLFTYNLLGMVFRGHIEKYWFVLLILMFGLGVLFAEFSRYLIRFGVPKVAALFPSAVPDGTNESPPNPLMTKDTTAMPENTNSGNKILHINHGESYHNNAPGGMMNFAPVTVIQNLGAQPADPEPAQAEPQKQKADPAVDTDTIDILGLMDFSARLRMPGVSRNTIDNILQKANIKPCSTEKDGRAIRYLYPRKESKAAVSDYIADKNI